MRLHLKIPFKTSTVNLHIFQKYSFYPLFKYKNHGMILPQPFEGREYNAYNNGY